MEGIGNDRRSLVRAIYEQHRAYIRHLEIQRLCFTMVFAVLFGGALVVMRYELFDDGNWPAVGFLALLSLIGWIYCLSVQRQLNAYERVADLVVARHDLKHYLPGYKNAMPGTSSGVSILFSTFFLLCLAFSLFALLQILTRSVWIGGAASFCTVIAGAVAIFGRSRPIMPVPEDD